MAFSLLRNMNRSIINFENQVQTNSSLINVSRAATTIKPGLQQKNSPTRLIKKLPPELRRPKLHFDVNTRWYTRLKLRLQHDSQFLRSVIQFSFILLCIWIGIEFYLFAKWGTSGGGEIFYERPPGVEGFLPISALISFKYWIQTGIVNDVHPSGLFIFLGIVVSGLLLKKAFCSWLCPVGTLSESLWLLGKKIFGKNISVTKWLDYPLRSLKYLLLVFFAWSIWQMDVADLKAFIYSPYNKMADIKMFMFFANITTFALWTIIILMVFSLFIKNFWCRYLCPYGALLGALSWLSPLKITRDKSTCIDCELCTKACPSNIKVHAVNRVWSDECMNCLACVQVCPVKETLDIRMSVTKTKVPNWVFATLVVGIFVAITGLAMLTGHWQNNISQEEYAKRFKNVDSPLYQHNHGSVPKYDTND
jgi:polyferredoxin